MTLYPEKQRKLQQEVDDVIGGRLPRLADRPRMHYMEAVSFLLPTLFFVRCQKESVIAQKLRELGRLFITHNDTSLNASTP